MQIKAIKTIAEHQAVLSEISDLMGAQFGTPEGERLSKLAAVVEAFEAKNFPVDSIESLGGGRHPTD